MLEYDIPVMWTSCVSVRCFGQNVLTGWSKFLMSYRRAYLSEPPMEKKLGFLGSIMMEFNLMVFEDEWLWLSSVNGVQQKSFVEELLRKSNCKIFVKQIILVECKGKMVFIKLTC